jgi:hypothetical protein
MPIFLTAYFVSNGKIIDVREIPVVLPRIRRASENRVGIRESTAEFAF